MTVTCWRHRFHSCNSGEFAKFVVSAEDSRNVSGAATFDVGIMWPVADGARLAPEQRASAKRNALNPAPAFPLDPEDDHTVRMVWIPEGEFMMGDQNDLPGLAYDKKRRELPRHKVTFSRGFFMGSTEVTVGQFLCFGNFKSAHINTQSLNRLLNYMEEYMTGTSVR